jgi:hypothetical protein
MPKVRGATDEEKKARAWSIPAGRYVLGWTKFERKNGKERPFADFLRVRFCTVKKDGTNGKGFNDIMGLMVDPKGNPDFEKRCKFNVTRLQILIEVLGISEEFEIGDTSEGIESAREGDRNFARLFCGRAFVAEVTRTESGGYTNNNVNRLITRSQWTEQELAKVQAWEAAQLGAPGSPEDAADDSHVAASGASTDDQYDDELDPADGAVEDW